MKKLFVAVVLCVAGLAQAEPAKYSAVCKGCHDAAMAAAMSAPAAGDAAAWAARAEAKGGVAGLVASAKAGVAGTAMMPAGGCGDCSDADLEEVVKFMSGL